MFVVRQIIKPAAACVSHGGVFVLFVFFKASSLPEILCVAAVRFGARRRRGTRRRRRIAVPALAALFSRQPHVHQNHVLADFDDISNFDKHAVFLKTEAVAVRRDDAQPSVFGIAKYNVTHLAQLPSVLRIDDLFRAQFRKAQFHIRTALNKRSYINICAGREKVAYFSINKTKRAALRGRPCFYFPLFKTF